MKLWIASFLLLFFAAETAQWLGQLPWLSSPELSMPLTILGGVGLAIASNASPRVNQSRSNLGTAAPKPPETSLPSPQLESLSPTQQTKASKADTISFEIKKAGQK